MTAAARGAIARAAQRLSGIPAIRPWIAVEFVRSRPTRPRQFPSHYGQKAGSAQYAAWPPTMVAMTRVARISSGVPDVTSRLRIVMSA